VQTIHAFCLGLLKEHAIGSGLDPEFTVLEDREAEREQASAMDAVLDRMAAERREEFAALVEAWQPADCARALRSVYESLRMGGGATAALARLAEFSPEEEIEAVVEDLQEMLRASPAATSEPQMRRVSLLQAWLAARAGSDELEWLGALKWNKMGLKAGHPLYDGKERLELRVEAAERAVAGARYVRERAAAREALIEFDEEYRRRKRARAALDFGDFEEKALELLRRDAEVREATREKYAAILMDELQDTNPVQWAILDLVRRKGRFFAVGDINQSIYGFRNAAPEQFAAYEKGVAERGWTVDRLEENYRSRAEILAAVEEVTVEQRCEGVTEHRLLAGRQWGEGEAPYVEVQRVATKEANEEALWIARRLRELHGTTVGEPGRPARYRDMAILARTNKVFDGLEEALERYGIPSIVKRGRNFFEAPECLDLTNWLRVLENPGHEIALYGLLRSPFFGISDEELMRLPR
jgi:ATP-dependent exoDNAse (exonuclease V) beta subunit